MKNNNKGFSLVELIVVIAIMAVLVGVLAPTLLRYVEKSRAQKDESAAEEVRNAVVIALADEDCFNEVATGSTVTVNANDNGGLVFSKASGVTTTNLDDEVKATVGNTVKFTSAAHKAKTYTITITINGDNVTTVGSWES